MGQDNIVSQFVDYVSSFWSKPEPKPAAKPAPRAATPPRPRYETPNAVPRDVMHRWLEGAGFNAASVDRLMEVNPRLALMAIEAKEAFDADPANDIKDRQGRVIGHKTFQIQPNGGFRTVRDQQGPTSAGNSQASASRFQSHHQHGQALDFWIYNKVNGVETMTQDTAAEHPYYERAADKFAASRFARPQNITRDEMRIELNGSPDWGHIELPERVRGEWTRNPRTGQVSVVGRVVPETGIDPDLHRRPGPTYSLQKPS
ncbi:MAG: hypothetical protein ACAH80_12165 [Alphaproteobacteria bacterium]